MTPPFTSSSAEVYQQALERAPELRGKLLERSQVLIGSGYHAQVKVAEDSTLVFVTRKGNRLPVHERDGEYFGGRGRAHPSLKS